MIDKPDPKTFGRFDVHSHLLPGIDDGCADLDESLRCARAMVSAGYTHSFVTPHYWSSYPNTTTLSIPQWSQQLQVKLSEHNIPLRLYPGGEINLRANLMETPIADLPTFGMQRKYALIDLWADKLPKHFEPTIKWMQSAGLTVILAHPERMRAVQVNPALADYFADLGVLLQGNLQCFSDAPHADTRRVVEQYLKEDRYFLLGSDLHNSATLECRLEGLRRATKLLGADKIDQLTITHPRTLLEK